MKNVETRKQEIKGMLIGRMMVEGVVTLDDASLDRAFSNCVAPEWCIRNAKLLMNEGLLAESDLRRANNA